jgi:hypothetical protein
MDRWIGVLSIGLTIQGKLDCTIKEKKMKGAIGDTTTLSIMTLSKMTLSIIIFSITKLDIITLSIISLTANA